jgi:hypothetical protein
MKSSVGSAPVARKYRARAGLGWDEHPLTQRREYLGDVDGDGGRPQRRVAYAHSGQLRVGMRG